MKNKYSTYKMTIKEIVKLFEENNKKKKKYINSMRNEYQN